MKRKIDNETIARTAAKTVTWAEGTKLEDAVPIVELNFKKLIQAIRKEHDFEKAIKIMKSLSPAQALDVMHHQDGKLIIDAVKLAEYTYRSKHKKYDKKNYENLFRLFLNLDEKFTNDAFSEATSDLVKLPVQPYPLFAICKHFEVLLKEKKASLEAINAEATAKASDDDIAGSGSGSNTEARTEIDEREIVVSVETTVEDQSTKDAIVGSCDIVTEAEHHSSLAVSREREESKFKQLKDTLRKKDIVIATKILQSLPKEEAKNIINQDEGKIIVMVIKLAYLMMKDHSYRKEEFKEIYSVFLALDRKDFERGILVATKQILEKSVIKLIPELNAVFKHIDEVSKEVEGLKTSSTEVASTSIIDKEDETSLDQVKNALRKHKIVEATSILRSLSTEEARDLLHKNDGQIVIDIIKLAYREMKHHRYNIVEFRDLYSILLDSDEKYFRSMVSKAISQITDKTFFQMMDVYLYKVSSHIGEVRLEKDALKASSGEAVSTSTIDKVDEIPFDQIEQALRENKIKEATRILQSLSREEANEVIHQNDGSVVICAIKVAHDNMKKVRYDKEEFVELYERLVGLDPEYVKDRTIQAGSQIIDRCTERINSELIDLGKHMDEVYARKTALKASSNEDSCKSEPSGSGVPHVTDDKEAAAAPDGPTSSDGTEQKDQDRDCSTKDKQDTLGLESDIIQYSNTASVFCNKRAADSVAESNSVINDSNYLMNFFFGWLNALPNFIQESIKQNSAFQVFLANYKELQSMLTVNQNEIILPSAEESINKTKSVNYIDLEQRAHIIYDQNSPFIGIDSMLTPSVLATLPITMISGLDNCELLGAEKAYNIDYQIPIFK